MDRTSRKRPSPAVRTLLAWALLLAAGCGLPGPERGRVGMVVSADSIASSVGLAVLARGGNAVDAAVAVGFALAVTYPEAGNIGGGGFLLIRGPDGEAHSVDFRETAPRRSAPAMYAGNPGASVDGCLAPAVPGTVAGLLAALESYGTMDRKELLAPAIALASGGIRVNENLASNLDDYREVLSASAAARAIFFRGDEPLRTGDLLLQTDLAATLRRISDSGTTGFYSGPTARLVAEHMQACGGLLDESDLVSYRAVNRPVLTGTYRGYTIQSMGLPSSGGLCILQALALLESYDLGALGHGSERSVHLIAEAMKRAFSMRAAYLGDPDFVRVSGDELLKAARTARAPLAMDSTAAVPSDSLDGFPVPPGGSETTHFSVVDRAGTAVAVTYTVNDLFGNKTVVPGVGFFLNDEMDDFVTIPGEANIYGLVGGEENMIAPGKRPLSSMSPTIVSKDGKLRFVLGARGGSRIISAVLQSIVNYVDFDLDPEASVRAPRFHHQWRPDTLVFESGALSPAVQTALERRGHRLREVSWSIGAIEAIAVDPATGELIGVPDPRDGGFAAGR